MMMALFCRRFRVRCWGVWPTIRYHNPTSALNARRGKWVLTGSDVCEAVMTQQ